MWGDEVKSIVDSSSKSPPVAGLLIGCLGECLPDAEITAIGLEFGTVELDEVLEAIRGDNWLYARGLASGLSMQSPLPRAIKARVRAALTVDVDDWKDQVFARAAEFTRKAYRGLTG